MTWQESAACAGMATTPDADLWHDVEHVGKGVYEDKAAKAERARQAKAVCATCPVKAQCLETATSDDLGIRGGLTLMERAANRVCGDGVGTVKGYRRHRRAGDAPCTACCDGWAAYQRARRAKEAAA